ncbi:MAG: HAMP domain-containing protein, partial [Planctomycetota bacterium]
MTEPAPARKTSLRLGSKVTLSIALVQIPLLALIAFLHIQEMRQEYLDTVKWRSQALAQQLVKQAADLSGYSHKRQRTLVLGIECRSLLNNNRNEGITHVGVIDPTGLVIAHTDTELIGQVEHREIIAPLLRGGSSPTALSATAYDTLVPVKTDPDSLPVAVLDIGFSREAIDLKVRDTLIYTVLLALLALLLFFLLLTTLLGRVVTHPVEALSQAAATIADGEYKTPISVARTDELGSLAGSFERMRTAIQKQIADLNHEIHDREEAQRQLSEREEDLRVTLDSIGDAVIATDTQGRITRLNPVAATLTGWSAEEAVAAPMNEVFRIINANTRQAATSPVQEVLDTGRVV